MAVGKSSLGRVAQSGAHAEVAATAVTPVEKKGTTKAAAKPVAKEKAKAPAVNGAAKTPQNKIYAVGDALPVHLL